MNYFKRITEEWKTALEAERKSNWWSLLESKDLQIGHYAGFLGETYHYTRINPQTQAYATMFFNPSNHWFTKTFLNHAVEEIAHDQLALNDLENLGIDRDVVVNSQPWPMTTAFSALPFLHLQFGKPLAYLGHIFHLEFIATLNGGTFIEILKSKGIRDSALSFIGDHAKIDPHHNDLMQSYIEKLIKSETDCSDLIYGAKTACRSYSKMLDDACYFGEREFALK